MTHAAANPSSTLVGLLAETSLHVGAGRTVGAIDLPFAREAATDVPFVPGSGLKGALRDAWRQHVGDHEAEQRLFGQHDDAGALLIGDARLLLLPVRSLTSSFRWLTCPLLLERLARDAARANTNVRVQVPAAPTGEHAALAHGEGPLHLEERTLSIEAPVPEDVITAVSQLVAHEKTRERLPTQLAIVGDDEFTWFARYALDVRARNVLDPETKTSQNLWYEETLPPDALLYALITERPGRSSQGALDDLRSLFGEAPYLQVGGNETVGQGWLAVHWAGERS